MLFQTDITDFFSDLLKLQVFITFAGNNFRESDFNIFACTNFREFGEIANKAKISNPKVVISAALSTS